MPLEIRGAHFLIRSAQLVRKTRLEYRPCINRSSFAVANQVVTLTHVTSERVV